MSHSKLLEPDISDYRLIDDDSKHKTYACSNSGCSNIVESAQMLNCDKSHHKKIKRLFCPNCAVWWHQKNECPITHHESPIFKDNEQFDIPQLRAICPYSLKFKQRSLNINGTGRVEVEEKKMEEKEGDGVGQILITNYNLNNAAADAENEYCNWRNEYKKLEKHVNECGFRPMACEYIGCMAKLIKRRYVEHKEEHMVQHLDMMNNTVKSLDNQQQVISQECLSNKEEIITALNQRKNKHIQSNKVKKEEFNRVTVGILVLLLSMIVFVFYDKFYIQQEIVPIQTPVTPPDKYDKDNSRAYQLLLNELKSNTSESQIRIVELESEISQLENTVSDLRTEIKNIWKEINAKPSSGMKVGVPGWIWNWKYIWWVGFVFKAIFNFAMFFMFAVAADPFTDKERKRWLAGYLFCHFILLSWFYNFDYWIVYVLVVAIQYIGFAISIFKDSPGPLKRRRLDDPVILWFCICSFINFCVWYYFYQDGIFYFIYMIWYGFWCLIYPLCNNSDVFSVT